MSKLRALRGPRGFGVVGASVLLTVGILGGGGQGAAVADGIGEETTFDVTQVTWDLSEEPTIVDQGIGSPLGWNDTSESDPLCILAPVPPPDNTYTYKTVEPGYPLPAIQLYADEWLPTTQPLQGQRWPVMVLLHGGGWGKGCRTSMSGVAYNFAHSLDFSYHFIVITIAYRLSCNPADPEIQGSQLAPVCGWTYERTDPSRNGQPGAAFHDAQDAVAWVRTTWAGLSNHNSIWNHKIALVGGSAGGNLSLLAAIRSTGNSLPDVVAGLSAFPRFTKMLQNTVWGCDQGQSDDPKNCAIGVLGGSGYWEGGLNRYLPCDKLLPPPPFYDTNNDCHGNYAAASPWDVMNTGLNPPPTYLVNGGGPDPGVSLPELASLQAAQDFIGSVPPEIASKLCAVNSTKHATHLLNEHCNDDPLGPYVRVKLVDWLYTWVCDDTHPCST